MSKLSKAVAVSALLVALGISACGGSDDGTEGSENGQDVRVAAMFGGPVDDNGYGSAHSQAMETAAENVGGVEVTSVESVPFTDQLTQTTLELFQQGNDVVFDINAAGPLFYSACEQVPDKKCVEYYPVENMTPNMSGFYPNFWPMYFVEGVAAGELTKTGTVGFVSAFKQNFNVAMLNAFALGCRSVRPDCTVRNVYINSFFDPPKATEATNTLIDQDADVINSFMNDVSPIQVAQKRGVWAFGVYIDQSAAGPDAWVTGVDIQDGISEYYDREFAALVDGTWEPGRQELTPTNLSPWGENVPPAVREAGDQAEASVIEGENPFVGPISDADGKVRVPEGDSLSEEFVYSQWSWPVEGVIGG